MVNFAHRSLCHVDSNCFSRVPKKMVGYRCVWCAFVEVIVVVVSCVVVVVLYGVSRAAKEDERSG